MRKEQVISKGKYTHQQPNGTIGVKQYLFIRDTDGKKRLLLRFANGRAEECSKFIFILTRLDAKGNVLGEEKLESADRRYAGREVFSFDRKIDVEERCTDFKVRVAYARYGSYIYQVENNELHVDYTERKENGGAQTIAAKIKPRKISTRAFDMPWIFAFLSLLVLALAFAVTGFLLSDYTKTEKDFSLSGVHYKFVDRSREDVVITGCSDSYREITLANNVEGHKVTGIKNGAFEGNKNLVAVTIDGVNVDKGAFEGCKKLEELTIKNITSIGEKAFYDCDSLESVTVEGNKSLVMGSRVFGDCEELLSVNINQTLIYGEKVDYFKGSEQIESLKLKNFAYTMKGVESAYYTSLNVLFGEDDTLKSASELKSLTVVNMDAIPNSFVRGFKYLESVAITGKEIKAVGNNAFRDCKRLNTFTIKGRLESVGAYAFAETAITGIDVSRVSVMGNYAFYNASKLSSVVGFGNGGIESVPKSAFEGCSSLSAITMSDKIKFIYQHAFKNSGFKKLSIPQGVEYESGIIAGCEKLEELSIYELPSGGYVAYLFGVTNKNAEPSEMASYIPTSLKTVSLGSGTEINAHAFKGCRGVTRINLPEGVVSFGNYAFAGCESLELIDIPSTTLKYIGAGAFEGTAIKSIILPTTLEFVGEGVLKSCNKLSSVTLPFLGQAPNQPNGTVAYLFGGAEYIPQSLSYIDLVPNTTMVSLPSGAFEGCVGASTIKFPSTVTVIGENAFKDCQALAFVDLSKVMTVGVSAFSGCNALTYADLSSVISIGNEAFRGCSALSSVVLGASLTNIGERAFKSSGLISLEIPDGVKTIGLGIIESCGKLVSLKTPYLGSSLSSVSNANIAYMYGEASGLSDSIPKALTSVEITKDLVSNRVPDFAFYGCQGLTSVTLPYGVTEVGVASFYGCKALSGFDFTGIQYIRDSAFYNCEALTSCNLADALIIEGYAFYNTGLTAVEIPYGIDRIEDETFKNCTKLQTVLLPSTLYRIGNRAFENTAIRDITLPSSITYIGNEAFKQTPLVSLELPREAYLGEHILEDCNSIESLSFPYTDEFGYYGSVSDYLFCESDFPSTLKSITVNYCTTGAIYNDSFSGAQSVEEIIIQGEVYSIGDYAFYDCPELRYVSLPESAYYISSNAFGNCHHLYEISYAGEGSLEIPYVIAITSPSSRAERVEIDGYTFALYNSEWYLINYPSSESLTITSVLSSLGRGGAFNIPAHLFYGDGAIKSVTLPEDVKSVGVRAFADCDSLTEVSFNKDSSVTSIGKETFTGCDSLKNVVLPNSVDAIGENAFYECGELESVDMPTSLRTIGDYAFYGCANLNNIKLYGSVSSIGKEAFFNCLSLYDVYSSGSLSLIEGSFDYGYVARYAVKVHTNMNEASSVSVIIDGIGTFRRSGGAWLLVNGSNVEKLSLTEFKYQDVKVTSYRIAYRAFEDCYNIKEITIGNAVKQIQNNAFDGCTNLVKLDMSGNSSLKEIERYAFARCSSLRYAHLPSSVTTLGRSVFMYDSMLEEVTMPTALVTIENSAFEGCRRLVSVTFNSKVEQIGTNAFYDCEHLFEVYDLSPYINVYRSSDELGYAGYYAAAVYTSQTQGLDRHEENGFKFIYAFNKWNLYSYVDNGERIATVPDIGQSLVILPYSIINGSFDGLVLPKNLNTIRSNAIYNCHALSSIYYSGNQTEWYSVSDQGNYYYYYNVYYYDTCVHYDTSYGWTYDANGQVTTENCKETSSITVSPNCYETGTRTHKCACAGCSYSRTTTEDMLDHEFVEGTCKNCGQTVATVTQENLQTYIDAGRITVDGFVYNTETNRFASTNKEDYSVSELEIVADERITVSFNVKASSETGADYVVIYINGVSYKKLSGNSSFFFYERLEAGDVITIAYEKDGSVGRNDDCGYVFDLQIVG
ncbi:MAG: leucine-rich repeat protein [Clostridia bacterium]|nr:leucine-rich repeat protein [Clostridia bacterium]